MAGNDVDLKISAVVGDSTELKKLAAEIEAMGGDAAETSAEADALNKALEQLGQKQTAIDAFKKQKTALAESAQAMQAAQIKAQELGKALSETENASKKQTTEFEKARKAARDTADAYEKQQVALQNSRATLKEAGIATSNLSQAQIEVTKATKDAAKAQGILVESTRERVAEVKKTVAAEDTAAQAAKERAAAEVKAADEATAAEESRTRAIVESAAAQQKAFQDIAAGSAKVAAVSVPFVGMVKSAVDFESAMTDVAKVVDGTDAQIGSLAERIKVLSTELPISATELAKMAEAGGQLGVPIEKLEQFILLAAKMGTAFNISADEAGQAVAKLANVFNLPLESVSSLGDAINLLGNTTAARESDIIDVLTRVGGAGVQFGLTAEQVAALAATMLSLGMTSEVASTGINAMLSKLQTANVQGADFQDALGRMGVSANQLAADIRANPQQALTTFLSTLKDLDSQARAEIVTKLFGLEYQDDIARMVGSLDQYQAALGKVGDQANYAGAMQSEFDKRSATTESQLKRLENSINTVSINLGSIFLPAVNSSADSMAGLTSALAEFIQQNPALAGMATSIGAVGVAGDGLLQVMSGLNQAGVTSFSQISSAIAFTQQNMTALVGTSGTAATRIAAAGSIAAAGWIGWNIGTTLKEQFVEVELAGIALSQGMEMLAVRAQYAFDIINAPKNNDGIFGKKTHDEISRLNNKLAEDMNRIETGYGDMAMEAIAAREPMVAAPKAAAVAVAVLTEEQKRAADSVAKLAAENTKLALEAAKIAEVYKQFGITSLKSLNDAAQGAATLYANMVQAKAPVYELDQAYSKMVETQLKAAAALGDNALKMKVAMFEATAATDAQRAAIAKIKAEVEGATPGINSLAEAYKTLGITAPDALQKTADETKAAYEKLVAHNAELEKQPEILGQISVAGDGVKKALGNVFTDGKEQAADYVQGLQIAIANLKTAQVEALKLKDGTAEGAAAFTAKMNELNASLQTAQGELKKTQDSMAGVGESAKQAAIPLATIQEAFLKYAETAIKANGGVADSALTTKAAQLGLKDAVIAIEQAVLKASPAMKDLQEKYKAAGEAAKQESDAVKRSADAHVAAAKTALDSAKAKGDENEISRASAVLAQAEADAAYALAQAKYAEAEAAAAYAVEVERALVLDGAKSEADQRAIADALAKAAALRGEADAQAQAAGAAQDAANAATESASKVVTATASAGGGLAAVANTVSTTWQGMAQQAGISADQIQKYGDILVGVYDKAAEAQARWLATGQRGSDPMAGLDESLRQAADAAQFLDDKIAQLQETGSNSNASLIAENLELKGQYEQAAKVREDALTTEIELNIQLMEVEAQKAALAGDDTAYQAATKRIELLKEELRLTNENILLKKEAAKQAEAKRKDDEAAAKAEETRRASEPTKPTTTQAMPAVDTRAITEAIKGTQAGTPTVNVYLDSKQIASQVQIAINDNIRRGLN